MHSDASQVPGLSGMTVNERLFALGLVDEFDAAARRRSRDEMVALLRRAELSDNDAAASADAILADPARFGY
jgi:hypothetical protein